MVTMLGAELSPWVIGANAGSIILALIGFYQFVMKGLDKRIDYRVGGDLRAHMASEEKQARKVRRALSEIRSESAERKSLLDAHMAHDEEVLARSAAALSEGQQRLLGQLADQHAETVEMHKTLGRTVKKHVKADAVAFARIEEKLE